MEKAPLTATPAEAEKNEKIYVQSILAYRSIHLVFALLNIVGFLAHGFGVVFTLTTARMDLQFAAYSMETVTSYNVDGTLALGRRPDWTYSLYPSIVILCFFALSCGFHLILGGAMLIHYLSPETGLGCFYLEGMYKNVGLWRWLEYFFSASILFIVVAPLLGIRNVETIVCLVALMATTQLFGWITERVSSEQIEADVSGDGQLCGFTLRRRWKRGSGWLRFQCHILGYVPYLVCWGIVLHEYRMNMETLADLVPPFAQYSVISGFLFYTLFGAVQALLQVLTFGPSLYWIGEIVYIVLSFTAKANFGIVVIINSLMEGAMYDAILGAFRGEFTIDQAVC